MVLPWGEASLRCVPNCLQHHGHRFASELLFSALSLAGHDPPSRLGSGFNCPPHLSKGCQTNTTYHILLVVLVLKIAYMIPSWVPISENSLHDLG
jgi:hypothetical protein